MRKLASSFPVLLVTIVLTLCAVGCSKEAKKKRYLAKADQDFKAERYDRAEVEYLAVLTIPPASPEAFAKLARLYLVEGKVQQARALLQKAVDLEPGNRELLSLLGTARLDLGLFPEAHKTALQLLEMQPQDTEALLLLSQSSLTPSDANDAQQRLEALPASARESSAFHLARGIVLVIQRATDKAETEFKAAIAIEPKSSRAYLLLANLYLIRNEPRLADEALRTAALLAPMRSAERLRYADWQLRNGAAEGARQTVEEITRKAPDYAPAWVFLARMAFAQQKGEECAGLLKTALARDPFNLEALLLKGTLLLGTGDTTNAITHFERVAQIYPEAPQVHYGLALAQFQYGEVAKALASVNRSLAINRNFPDSLVFLAHINLRTGDTGSAIAVLKGLLREQPQMKQPYLLLASAYVIDKNLDDAVSVYHQMTEQFPDDPEPPLLSGMILIQQRKLVQARHAVEQSLRLSPNSLGAIEQLVELDLLEKKYVAATQRVKEQITQNPTAAEPHLLMAKIEVAQALKPGVGDTTNRVTAIPVNLELENTPEANNHVEQAQTALENAIRLNKNLRNGYLLLAQLLVASHKSDVALTNLLSFTSGTNDVAALMQIGMIYEQLTNPPAARDAYEKALGLDPQFGLALNNLAYLYSEKLNKQDKAYEMAAKARDLMPSDPYTADTLGWILYRRNQYSRALGLIEESAMRLTDDPEIQYHLGMTFYAMGDEESARRALERASSSARELQLKEKADQALSVLAINVDTAGAAETARLQQALTNNPADPVALMRLAEIQSHKGDYRNALANYESALSTHPQNGRLLFKIAELCSEHLNERARALELAKRAHDLLPEDAAVSRLLGRLLCQQGDYRDYNWAVNLLEEADRKLPGDLAVSYDLALAYYNLGRVADAEKTMRKVTAGPPNGPRHADAELFLSMLALLGDPASLHASSAKVQAVLRQQPDYIPALMVSARLLEDQLDFQGAARVYGDILRRNPLFVPATRNLALLYFEHLNNEAKAYELAIKARESFLEDVALTRALGILCYKRAEYRQTVLLLGRGPAASADSEQLYYLGMAYYQLKDNPASKTALRMALDLKLKPQLASEANRVLNTMN